MTPSRFTDPAARRVARVAALNAEIESLGKSVVRSAAAVRLPPTTPERTTATAAPAAPALLVKRKAGRFRLPRSLKSELMDRFCSDDSEIVASLTTLVVVAHPDDESIGAGARLRHLGDAYLVEVTDGAPSDPACAIQHGFATPEEYAAARRSELLQAMQVAGLPENRLISLGLVDGQVTFHLTELCLRITDLIDSLRPLVVLTHPYEGGHTDHDSTAFAVHLACGILRREGVQPPAVLELTSYHARNGARVVQQFLPHPGADRAQRVIHLSDTDRQIKERLFECFGSQRTVLENFSTSFERFRAAPRYVFTRPPHEGILNYERYGDLLRGRFWRDQAQRALRALRLRRDQ